MSVIYSMLMFVMMTDNLVQNSTSFRQSEYDDFKFEVAEATPKWDILNLDLICLNFLFVF